MSLVAMEMGFTFMINSTSKNVPTIQNSPDSSGMVAARQVDVRHLQDALHLVATIRTDSRPFRHDEATNLSLHQKKNKTSSTTFSKNS